MGEIADMILDGTLDEQTGEYIGEPCGYPRTMEPGFYNSVKKNPANTRANKNKLATIRAFLNDVYGIRKHKTVKKVLKEYCVLTYGEACGIVLNAVKISENLDEFKNYMEIKYHSLLTKNQK